MPSRWTEGRLRPRRAPCAEGPAALGAGGVIASIVSWWVQRGHLAATMGFYGAFFLTNAFSFLYTTRRGKFHVWEEILDDLRLGGDERVLDMGCGRGAVLTAVAKRLRTGRVTGRRSL